MTTVASPVGGPEILEVSRENEVNFKRYSLIFLSKDSPLISEENEITLQLQDDLNKEKFEKTYKVIYYPEKDKYFIDTTSIYYQKLIACTLIFEDKEFSFESLSNEDYRRSLYSSKSYISIKDKIEESDKNVLT